MKVGDRRRVRISAQNARMLPTVRILVASLFFRPPFDPHLRLGPLAFRTFCGDFGRLRPGHSITA